MELIIFTFIVLLVILDIDSLSIDHKVDLGFTCLVSTFWPVSPVVLNNNVSNADRFSSLETVESSLILSLLVMIELSEVI